jgi:hypothetical protein
MNINRRDLVKLAACALLMPSCLRRSSSPEARLKEILYYGVGNSADANAEAIGAGVFDFETEIRLTLENEIHSVTYSPELDMRVYLPKLGKVGYYQKGISGTLMPIKPAAGKFFYGHGAFDVKRKVFYSTQSTVNSEYQRDQLFDKGDVHAHDLADFSIVKTFPSFGNNPHDLKLFGDELIVCNGGDKSNVAFIDLNTQKLSKSFDLPTSPHISFGHLDITHDGSLLVATGSRKKSLPCKLFSISSKTGIKPFEIPQGLETFFLGQLLSVIHHGDYAYATCPATSYVFAWDLSGKFLSALSVKNASSLAYSPSRKQVLVGSGNFKESLRGIIENKEHLSLVEISGHKVRTGSHATLIMSR